jgi:hypothetical protein
MVLAPQAELHQVAGRVWLAISGERTFSSDPISIFQNIQLYRKYPYFHNITAVLAEDNFRESAKILRPERINWRLHR